MTKNLTKRRFKQAFHTVFCSDTYSEMSDLDETLPRRSPDINEGFSGDYAILNLDLGVELNKKHM